MAVRISRSLLDRIGAEAAASPGREICGLMLGSSEAVTDLVAADNVAADPASRFEIDPAALFPVLRQARAGGPALAGYYHSHPSGSVEPSPCDAAQAEADGMLWLIAAGGGVSLWRAGSVGLHGRFTREAIIAEVP